MNSAETTALASKHLAIAIQLMGLPWVVAQIQQPVAEQQQQRGRKAGVVPEPDRRCAWHPEGRDQCKNSRSADTQYCKIHVQNVILLA
jgi:hypothetical protein